MKVGMLWFDNDTKSGFAARVERAAAYYRQKYGQTPTLCFVHPSMLPEEKTNSMPVEVRAAESIRPNHFWLGVNGLNNGNGNGTNGNHNKD